MPPWTHPFAYVGERRREGRGRERERERKGEWGIKAETKSWLCLVTIPSRWEQPKSLPRQELTNHSQSSGQACKMLLKMTGCSGSEFKKTKTKNQLDIHGGIQQQVINGNCTLYDEWVADAVF